VAAAGVASASGGLRDLIEPGREEYFEGKMEGNPKARRGDSSASAPMAPAIENQQNDPGC